MRIRPTKKNVVSLIVSAPNSRDLVFVHFNHLQGHRVDCLGGILNPSVQRFKAVTTTSTMNHSHGLKS